MGSAAPAVAREPQPEIKSAAPKPAANVDDVRSAVLNALDSASLTMLSSMLASGEWNIEGGELTIKVAASAALIDMSVSSEGKKIVIAVASGSLGRAMKLQVLPGGAPQTNVARQVSAGSNGSPRGRAEQEPVVKRMMEKFGAEIRTVIDYKQKR
jgi:hypothetical protein